MDAPTGPGKLPGRATIRGVLEVALAAFTSLFVVVDPLGNLPIFVTLTGGLDAAGKRAVALRGVAIAGAVLLLFALGGDALLAQLGIGLPAFRIAGGLMLLLIALEMVFERRLSRKSRTAEEIAAAPTPRDLAVFPIAIPLVAGPGAITSVLLLAGRARSGGETGIVLAMVAVVLLISLLLFLLAERIERAVGDTTIAIVSRLLGILLAALAVQYVLDGLREALFS